MQDFCIASGGRVYTKGSFTAGLYSGYTYNSIFSSVGYRSFTEYGNGHGYVVGIPAGYSITDWFTVYIEPSIIAKSYMLLRTGYVAGTEQNWRNTYFQMPLVAQFSFGGKNIRGFVSLGGYAGGWTNSHTWGWYRESTSFVSEYGKEYFYYFRENVKFDKERDNRFDGGLLIGLGLKYDFTGWGIFAEARYYCSLSDMQKNYMYEQVPRYNDTYVFTIGTTYRIKTGIR
jgi:hypothetical protein